MKAYELGEQLDRRSALGKPAHEFIRERSMSLSVYVLPPGGPDPQQPHGEDEVYYVVSGRAFIRVAEEDREVRAGTLVFVPARVEHHFHSILETLTVLVVFAPAKGSRAA